MIGLADSIPAITDEKAQLVEALGNPRWNKKKKSFVASYALPFDSKLSAGIVTEEAGVCDCCGRGRGKAVVRTYAVKRGDYIFNVGADCYLHLIHPLDRNKFAAQVKREEWEDKLRTALKPDRELFDILTLKLPYYKTGVFQGDVLTITRHKSRYNDGFYYRHRFKTGVELPKKYYNNLDHLFNAVFKAVVDINLNGYPAELGAFIFD